MSRALQGEATERSAASSEVCRAVNVPAVGGIRESRATSLRAKAMEAVKNPKSSREELLASTAWNVQKVGASSPDWSTHHHEGAA